MKNFLKTNPGGCKLVTLLQAENITSLCRQKDEVLNRIYNQLTMMNTFRRSSFTFIFLTMTEATNLLCKLVFELHTFYIEKEKPIKNIGLVINMLKATY